MCEQCVLLASVSVSTLVVSETARWVAVRSVVVWWSRGFEGGIEKCRVVGRGRIFGLFLCLFV